MANMAWNPPPPPPPHHQYGNTQTFWDFIQSFDPNRPGPGVDHVPPHPPPPPFTAGFPFGPAGRAGPAAGPWGSAEAWGPWARQAAEWAGPWWVGEGGGPGRRGWGRQGRWGGRHGPGGNRSGEEEEDRDAEGDLEERDVDMTEGVAGAAEKGEDKAAGDGKQKEKDASPGTMRDSPAEEDGDPSAPPPPYGGRRGRSHGRHHREHGHHGGGPFGGGLRGVRCGRGRGGFFGRGGPFGFAGPFGGLRGRHGPHGGPPFDVAAAMEAWASHPIAVAIRDSIAAGYQGYNGANQARAANSGDNNNANADAAAAEEGGYEDGDIESFAPPVDVFGVGGTDGSGESPAWVVHVAVPGAKKEDIGVNWDADRGVLAVSGVVHRIGDEAFLQGLVSGERKVGLFRREVKLPPPEVAAREGAGGHGGKDKEKEKEDVDVDGITAKLEDGVLVVRVPRIERGWTEVRKVDIL